MYNTYPSTYTTYDAVNEQLKALSSGASLTNDLSTVVMYIWEASGLINTWCERTFAPYINASEAVEYSISPRRVQPLPDDTLSVSSITDTSGAVLTASTYRLKDTNNNLNGYPYRYFELSSSASYSVSDTNGFCPSWTVNGVFGYSTQPYARAWLDTTTLDGGITDNATSINVTSASNIEILDYIRVDSEFMQVTAIDTNALTVTRGVNGSTADTHDTGVTVDVWQVHHAVKLACTRLAAWLYSSRQNEFQSIQFQDGTVAGINYPSIVAKSLRPLKHPIVVSGH